MKKVLAFVLAVVVAYFGYGQSQPGTGRTSVDPSNSARLEKAISERRTAFQVRGSGKVIRILSDDNDGSRHQRFIVQLESGKTVLVAHNIDLAPRVASLRVGDFVSFNGEYEWNERGGVIHWTHDDPQGRHVTGWIEHNGKRYH